MLRATPTSTWWIGKKRLKTPHPKAQQLPQISRRHLGNLVTWDGRLHLFHHLNAQHASIKVTYVTDTTKMDSLDTTSYQGREFEETGILDSRSTSKLRIHTPYERQPASTRNTPSRDSLNPDSYASREYAHNPRILRKLKQHFTPSWIPHPCGKGPVQPFSCCNHLQLFTELSHLRPEVRACLEFCLVRLLFALCIHVALWVVGCCGALWFGR